MDDQQLPQHITTFLRALRDDRALIDAGTAAVGDRTGNEAAQAAATYYQSQGYTISANELLDLFATNSMAAEELDDAELHQVSGGSLRDRYASDEDHELVMRLYPELHFRR